MRALFLDCFSGISGDMTVGALCDLGVKPSSFEWELSKLGIGDFHLHFEKRERQGINGVKFSVHSGAVHTHDQDEEPDEHGQVHAHAHAHDCGHDHGAGDHDHHEHGHDHEHGHGPGESHEPHGHSHSHAHAEGRSYLEIRNLIEESELSDFVKLHALGIFRRVAAAEAKIHGTPIDAIGFHEVGALDSIADIVCACVGIEELKIEKVFAGPLSDGTGWVDCAHGRYPIPAPATLEILAGIAVGQIDEPFEFITPTGAAIAAEFAESFGLMPRLRVERIGYGLGSRQLPGRPNALRAVLGEWLPESSPSRGYATDTITQIETNLDDLSPEITGAVVDKLFSAGALDVFLTPVQMKKNRPAVLLTVLCEDDAVERTADLIFRETSSFGLRLARKQRWKLERRIESVETPYGPIEVKIGSKDGRVLQAAPEYESCRAASERTGEPLRAVYLAAAQAYGAPAS